MADNYLSGKLGSFLVGTAAFSVGKWTLTMSTDTPKISNFTTAPYHAYLAALTGGKLKASAPYNQGNMPLTCGMTYTFVLGYSNTISISVTAIVNEITPTVDVEDAERIEISATVTGSFTAAIT